MIWIWLGIGVLSVLAVLGVIALFGIGLDKLLKRSKMNS
jgi:hypothetical protein